MMRQRVICTLMLGTLLLGACEGEEAPRGSVRASPTEIQSSPSPSPEKDAEPPASDELNFAVIGDFGSGTLAQLSVAARMCEWRKSHPYDLVITTGDNIYPDGSSEQFDSAFFTPYACLLEDGVQWRASLGNHDWTTDEGQPELDEPAFGMKGENYVVRESGVRFVIANSNEMDTDWLRDNLPAESGDRWTIVAFHHPVFSPGLHGSTETFAHLPKLFEKTGVDLVLNGHDHLYSVTEPVGGIRYVVTGGGGADLYPCLLTEESEVCELRHHFLYVSADGEDIEVKAVPDQGEPFHEFTTAGRD